MSSLDSRLGFILSAMRGGKIGANEYRVLNLPRVSLYRNGGLSVSTGASTIIGWDSLEYDSDQMYLSTDNTKIIVKTPGIYLFTTWGEWASSATGVRGMLFRKNGAGSIASNLINAANGTVTAQGTCAYVPMVKDDYMEVSTVQNSGAGLAFDAATLSARANGFQATLASTL